MNIWPTTPGISHSCPAAGAIRLRAGWGRTVGLNVTLDVGERHAQGGADDLHLVHGGALVDAGERGLVPGPSPTTARTYRRTS